MSPNQIIAWCQDYISKLLDLPADKIGPDTEIEDFGFDSAAAVSMVLDLETLVGRELDPAILFEHRTLRALANAVSEQAA